MKVLFVDTVHPYLWNALVDSGFDCREGYELTRAELIREIASCEGIVIRSRIILDKELLDAGNKLKFIARAGAGMENIDVACANEKNILCLNSPEGNRDAVGEHAIGMLLALFNNLVKADREVRDGIWIREGNRGLELGGKTVGIIGYGNMGRTFALKLSGFGCTVIAYDKYKSGFSENGIEEVNMQDLWMQSDIVSLHVPLTEETAYLVNDDFLSKFAKPVCLINTARGRCVNTSDLVKNLMSGKVSGACLDVLEYEDASFEKFTVRNSDFEKSETWQYLIHSDKVILSPHIGGWTYESNEKISKVLYDKIMKWKTNHPEGNGRGH
ncbi:MAG TPA: NAD(P)-dependent oxidoreductase [Bacteroidia bacterium]|nr:NAD(P)-dependent oxidoreductase [Bacteroidia bacterium]